MKAWCEQKTYYPQSLTEGSGVLKRRLITIILCIILVGSCAHTRIAKVQQDRGQRFYYTETDFLNYEVAGGGKIPIIFLHGLGASLRSWDDVLSCIPGDLFTSYLIDLKGFGLSSKPRDSRYSIKDNADLICRFLIEKRLQNFVLVGHSLGGAVALAVAVESLKNRLLTPAAMVLIDAAAYKTAPPFFVKFFRMPLLGRLLLSLPSSEFKARFVLKKIIYDHRKITPALIARYCAFMDTDDYSYALFKTAAALGSHDYEFYRYSCSELPYPVLVIWGAEDSVTPLSFGEQLIEDMLKAKMHIIDQCGHNPHEEFSEEVAEMIVSASMDAMQVGRP